MRGLYITNEDRTNPSALGVFKKIDAQLFAFHEAGLSCGVAWRRAHQEYLVECNGKVKASFPLKDGLLRGWRKTVFSALLRYIQKDGISFVYIRKMTLDMDFIHFVRRLKKSGVNVVLEFPTYPFLPELSRYLKRPSSLSGWAGSMARVLQESVLQYLLRLYVDAVTTYSNHREILGIPSIPLVNGMDLRSLDTPMFKEHPHGEFRLLAVASMAMWHGYDRVLTGMKQYQGNRKIILHLVGDGEQIPRYREMVKEYGLENNVIFHGFLSGAELEEAYEQADVALNSFGCHRVNIYQTSTLKSREYAIKGFPIATACEIDVFPSTSTFFIFKATEDERPVNIGELVSWYDDLCARFSTRTECAQRISEIAREKCDIRNTMQPVIQWLDKGGVK